MLRVSGNRERTSTEKAFRPTADGGGGGGAGRGGGRSSDRTPTETVASEIAEGRYGPEEEGADIGESFDGVGERRTANVYSTEEARKAFGFGNGQTLGYFKSKLSFRVRRFERIAKCFRSSTKSTNRTPTKRMSGGNSNGDGVNRGADEESDVVDDENWTRFFETRREEKNGGGEPRNGGAMSSCASTENSRKNSNGSRPNG